MRNWLCMTGLIIMLCAGMRAKAQPSASEGEVEYNKGNKLAAVIELPYPPETVEEAIKDYMAQKGVKGSESKGFDIYRSLAMKEGNPELNDLHFKIERKSRKEKNVSIVHLLVGRPGENVGLRTPIDRYKLEEAKRFLTSMTPVVEAHNLELDIAKQQDLLGKAEKKLKDIQNDQQSLEEKLNNIKTDQQKQQDEVIKQKTILEAMVNRRKVS